MLKKLFEQVAEEFKDEVPNISAEMVEHMWRHKYGFIREVLTEEPGQKFLDNKFGSYVVNIKHFQKYYDNYVKSKQNSPDFEEQKQKMEEILERAKQMQND